MKTKTIATVTREELRWKIARGEDCQIVNVLSPDYYHLGFIKGSLKIPLDKLETRLNELDKSREVVVYCANKECDASRRAAEKLEQLGFSVSAYEGGIEDWKEAWLPVE
jgi:rhodanese-related sulfurtransferase